MLKKKARLKRENRAQEDDAVPENTEFKQARVEVQMAKTTNPTVKADCQPRRSQ